MTQRLTLEALADNLIRESRVPFNVDDFLTRIQARWRRKIAPTTLDQLKQQLWDHDNLIGIHGQKFLPCQAVLDRIGQMPLAAHPGKYEWDRKIWIPGHQLVPFVPWDCPEEDLVFLDPQGLEIPKVKKTFFIEEVLPYYQYSDERYFPDQIKVNQWAPGKSQVRLTVWDISTLMSRCGLKSGDGFKVHLVDYTEGVFRLAHYTASECRQDRLRARALYVELEQVLSGLMSDRNFATIGLEKQLLQAFFSFKTDFGNLPPFALPQFVEEVQKLAVVRSENAGIHFGWSVDSEHYSTVWESAPKTPQGRTGSLNEIFEDMGLAITENEFKAMMYAVMNSDDFDIEMVFALLFGAKEDRFYDKKQHRAFYRYLRKLLTLICEELKGPESRLVSQLRNQTVSLKLRLVEILRYLEGQEVHLEDLPIDMLDQLADLDGFCVDTLSLLSDHPNPPDIKTLRDLRLGLQMIGPPLEQLEEDVYDRLGFY